MRGAATASDPREGHQIRGNSGETGSDRWNCETTSGGLETGSSESRAANSSLERHGQTGSDKEGDGAIQGVEGLHRDPVTAQHLGALQKAWSGELRQHHAMGGFLPVLLRLPEGRGRRWRRRKEIVILGDI